MHRVGSSLTHSARTPPAVHPGMKIWGVQGGSPPFLGTKFNFFLERQAKIQNRRQTPSGSKVRGRKERKRKKEEGRRIMPSLVVTTSDLARTSACPGKHQTEHILC